MRTAHEHGHKDSPQKIVSDMGIAYHHSTLQSISGEWWFWHCANIPEDLPPFLTVELWHPLDLIGLGLSDK